MYILSIHRIQECYTKASNRILCFHSSHFISALLQPYPEDPWSLCTKITYLLFVIFPKTGYNNFLIHINTITLVTNFLSNDISTNRIYNTASRFLLFCSTFFLPYTMFHLWWCHEPGTWELIL